MLYFQASDNLAKDKTTQSSLMNVTDTINLSSAIAVQAVSAYYSTVIRVIFEFFKDQ